MPETDDSVILIIQRNRNLTTTPDAPLDRPRSLAAVANAADAAASASTFARAEARLAPETRRRHAADLALFARYLREVAHLTIDLTQPDAWADVSWGLVEAWLAWQVQHGYAIGSINVRLATIKRMAKLAVHAGTLSPEAYATIAMVQGYRGAEGRRMDAARASTRRGAKKSAPTPITPEQISALKTHPDRITRLLACLLLDHGLRIGEACALEVGHVSLERRELTIYRSKVDKTQIHRMTPDTERALREHLALSSDGRLLPGSRACAARLAKAGQAIGCIPLSPHDCRHAWATRALANGTPLKALQDAGGWASPAMPLRYATATTIANTDVRLGE